MKNEIGEPCGNCPVQSDGFIDDHPYYFRSRGSHWTMRIAMPGGDPVMDGPFAYYKGSYVGPWPAAGWITVDDAKRFIAECVAEFKAGKRGDVHCECEECLEWRSMTMEQRIEKVADDVFERGNAGLDALKKFRKDEAEQN